LVSRLLKKQEQCQRGIFEVYGLTS
jgi:hypothetical protein